MAKKRATKKEKKVTAKTVVETPLVDEATTQALEELDNASTGVSGPAEPPSEGDLPKEEESPVEQPNDPSEEKPAETEPEEAELTKEQKNILAVMENLLQEYNELAPAPVFNVYTCRACGFSVVTKDVDKGTTPFMISCQKDGCTGDAISSFYKTGQNATSWDKEWYRPEDILEYIEDNPETKNHLLNGGLILRGRE